MSHDYFYGAESDSFSFYRVPRLLVTGEEYKRVSAEAKLLYGLLLDRMGLSARNGWYDELDRVYIYYTLDEIQEDMGCGHEKAVKLLAELDTGKGIDLIERVKQGQGKPTRIYVKRFAGKERPSDTRDNGANSRLPIIRSLEVGKTEVQTSENPKSRVPKTGSADFRKADASYINNNYTDSSYTDQSIVRKPLNGSHRRERQCSEIQELSSSQVQTQSPCALGFELGKIDGYDYTDEVKDQIDYELLCINYPYEDLSAYVELICEVYSSSAPIKIGGETLPASKVIQRYEKLTYDHIAYVIDSLNEGTTRIKNVKTYLLTALYNAPVTIGHYYAAAVRHDEKGV